MFPTSVHVYRLIPLTRFLHIGTVGGEGVLDFVPSDTLFAALVAILTERWGERAAEALGVAFSGAAEPPFLLTGAFPALPRLRLFPRPVSWSPGPGKGLRRLRWVSEGLFARIVRGERIEALHPSEGELGTHAPFRMLPEETDRLPRPMREGRPIAWRLWDPDFRRPSVVVSRAGGPSFLYQLAMVRYREPVSWWMAIAWGSRAEEPAWPGGPSFRILVVEGLGMLGERGIGGLRSRGGGAFRLEEDPEPLAVPVGPGARVVTLARYHPTRDELSAGVLTGPGAAYRLVRVGGWASAPGQPARPRRPIGMIEAGAVLEAGGRFPLGALVDARLDGGTPPPLWRYGLAFPVPMNEPDAIPSATPVPE